MKKLITLEENNNQKSETYDFGKPRLNGIECPNCKEELFDSNPMVTLTSYPAQKNIHCSKCNYHGYRIA